MTFARILVAVDASPQGRAAFALAMRLAADQAATLAIATVVGHQAEFYAPPDVVVDPTTDERIARDAQTLLTRAAAAAHAAGVTATALMCEGDIVDALLACIAEQHADLIVLGTHGRKGVARALYGSIAEGVIRGTKIPVLVAHAAAN
jgi:nucleotide-binding universal stress UspA family protein